MQPDPLRLTSSRPHTHITALADAAFDLYLLLQDGDWTDQEIPEAEQTTLLLRDLVTRLNARGPTDLTLSRLSIYTETVEE